MSFVGLSAKRVTISIDKILPEQRISPPLPRLLIDYFNQHIDKFIDLVKLDTYDDRPADLTSTMQPPDPLVVETAHDYTNNMDKV